MGNQYYITHCCYIMITKEPQMTKNLIKHGNSWALIIDRPILELLKIDHDTPLELVTDGDVLVIHPQRAAERQKEFQAALDDVNQKYSRVLKRLAE